MLVSFQSLAQRQESATEIRHRLDRLNVLGSVLYVAAHPDDENTRLISYFSNHDHLRTTYMSLTRGDGGQNLIGKELRELLGVLRTQELLAARRIDGGEQCFSRANDFGYSKHPDETLKIWDSTLVMSDLVRAIRKFKPDIIVNRFDHRTPGRTHGHHTSSAVLSYAAYELAGDPEIFPEQLESYEVWQPKRVFFNTSWWFYGSREKFDQADKSNMVYVDIGTYYPNLGISNSEIAAASRSMHKCQGFGNAGNRGKQLEYMELIKGEELSSNDPFDGINTTWSRVVGGEAIGDMVQKVIDKYDYEAPYTVVKDLLSIRKSINDLSDEYWKQVKLKEVDELIKQCLGLYISVNTLEEYYTQGDTVEVEIELVNRAPTDVLLKGLKLPWGAKEDLSISLSENDKQLLNRKFVIKDSWRATNHYWLNQEPEYGMYHVENDRLLGKPETPSPFETQFILEIEGVQISTHREAEYVYSDPVDAEVRKPLFIMPKAVAMEVEDGFLLSGDEAKPFVFKVKAFESNFSGKVGLELPEGWICEPKWIEVDIPKKGQEERCVFMLSNAGTTSKARAKVVIQSNDLSWDRELIEVDYDHIPMQKVLLPATTEVVKLDVKNAVKTVGYLPGAGDEIPESLRKLGITVDELSEEDVLSRDLLMYDAIILGIRILNTDDRIGYKMPKLLEYVYNGGNLIVQYNTHRNLKTERFAPYSIEISRDRVSDETATMDVIVPDHKVFQYPNRISDVDFNGWVQERGLYFPDQWDERYEAVFSCHDPGESPKKGALLIAPYGKGNYVYSGISWFRQLPNAVPGAYKMFLNLLALPENTP